MDGPILQEISQLKISQSQLATQQEDVKKSVDKLASKLDMLLGKAAQKLEKR